jgi:hypothetical protein
MTYLDILKWIGTVLFSIAGGGTIVLGLSGWLGKVWAERLMERERHEHARELELDRAAHNQDLEALKSKFERTHRRLQNELDKTIYGHQLKTQTEFTALMELWKKVPPLESAMANVRPPKWLFDMGALVDPEGYVTKNRAGLIKEGEALQTLVSQFGPFVDARIYDALQQLLLIARGELTETGFPKDRSNEWFERGATNVAKFKEVRAELFKLIAARVNEIAQYRDHPIE